ncbi:Tetratricopeptide-like helical [Penicillium longicatenatum]|nr:Tetratricopeptide-like helical [Penicillium longicatenatum]
MQILRKSQLAIEYSYRTRSESPEKWVFWVHASNAARFEQSFRDIAEQVKVPNRNDPQIDLFKLVENWLRDEKRGKWILILDNVDDDDLFHKHSAAGNAATRPLFQYLPASLPGYIIITSRSREVALKLVDYKDLVEIHPMDQSEGLELLRKRLDSEDNKDSRQLVEELEYTPLAIIQAAGYIRSRAPRYSVSRYLVEFRKSDREATNLLKQEANSLYRD